VSLAGLSVEPEVGRFRLPRQGRSGGGAEVRRVLTAAALLVVVGTSVGGVLWLWPRDDVVTAPAAVVVLGGAGAERTELGRDLATEHGAVLVLSSSAQHFGAELGLDCDVEVVCLDPVPETTRGEARAVAALAADRGWDHVTVATSRHHTSRARLLFRQCLGERVSVVGATRPDGSWWPGVWGGLREAVGAMVGLTVQRAC
jgi:uncharacterized SAM-binding protein YcdF (DUF218 family)